MIAALVIAMIGAALAIPAVAIAIAQGEWPQRLACGVRMQGCPYALGDVEKLIDQFCELWGEQFGDEKKIRDALRDLTIEWKSGDMFDYGSKKARGLTWSKKKITVASREVTGLRSTSLSHELVHFALWVTKNDPGHKHVAPGSVWTLRHEAVIIAMRPKV